MPDSVRSSASPSVACPSSAAVTVTGVGPAVSGNAAGLAASVMARDSLSASVTRAGSDARPEGGGSMPAAPPVQNASTASASSPSARASSTTRSSFTPAARQPLPGFSAWLPLMNVTSASAAVPPAARRRPQPV